MTRDFGKNLLSVVKIIGKIHRCFQELKTIKHHQRSSDRAMITIEQAKRPILYAILCCLFCYLIFTGRTWILDGLGKASVYYIGSTSSSGGERRAAKFLSGLNSALQQSLRVRDDDLRQILPFCGTSAMFYNCNLIYRQQSQYWTYFVFRPLMDDIARPNNSAPSANSSAPSRTKQVRFRVREFRNPSANQSIYKAPLGGSAFYALATSDEGHVYMCATGDNFDSTYDIVCQIYGDKCLTVTIWLDFYAYAGFLPIGPKPLMNKIHESYNCTYDISKYGSKYTKLLYTGWKKNPANGKFEWIQSGENYGDFTAVDVQQCLLPKRKIKSLTFLGDSHLHFMAIYLVNMISKKSPDYLYNEPRDVRSGVRYCFSGVSELFLRDIAREARLYDKNFEPAEMKSCEREIDDVLIIDSSYWTMCYSGAETFREKGVPAVLAGLKQLRARDSYWRRATILYLNSPSYRGDPQDPPGGRNPPNRVTHNSVMFEAGNNFMRQKFQDIAEDWNITFVDYFSMLRPRFEEACDPCHYICVAGSGTVGELGKQVLHAILRPICKRPLH